MSSHGGNYPSLNVTMVSVDKDKNSVHAFRWTINHIDNPVIIAAYVKHKNIPHPEGTNVFPPDEDDVATVFNPLRQLCNTNNNVIKMKEAVIDDSDVVRGVLEYARRNQILNIVVGAPYTSKNSLARSLNLRSGSKKYKGPDVSAAIMKSAPDYCSVYVISKGKIVAARPAIRPPPTENGLRTPTLRGGSTNGRSGRSPLHEMTRSSSAGESLGSIGQRSPYILNMSESDSSGSHKSGSTDATKQDCDLNFVPDSKSFEGMEAEMKRLRLKLKQTMDMYSSACKEAVAAQNKAKEINQWKQKEARIVQEVKMSKEAAIAMAEKEKVKAKAALEAAEEAIKMAEKEAQKRLQAEMKAKREAEEKDRALSNLASNDIRYRKYTIMDIENATEKFNPAMKIGEGGYGPVFKGQLDHTPVAIKILDPNASHGRRQFQQEVEVT
ncbi:hypothetical protein VNO77_32352 [Canavalia gladiata]|uniref:RING-type E3 ubiquitin transferase n=1 Tax=Canavalia gladiata TaxID=3824 RepID=A0AAN9KSQ0_CANGL